MLRLIGVSFIARLNYSADQNSASNVEANIIGVPEQETSVQDALIEITTDEGSDLTPLVYCKPDLRTMKGFFPLDDENYEGFTREYMDQKREFETETDRNILICDIPLVQAKMPIQILRKFLYFRTDWHVRIQVIAPAMEYGFLEGYCEPIQCLSRQGFYKRHTGATSHEDFQIMSCTTGFTLSVNEQETMEFDLPWPYPGTFLSLSSFANEQSFISFVATEFWSIHLNGHSIRKIQGGSEAPSCAVLMYVSFKDPILTGPNGGVAPWNPTGGLQAVYPVNATEPTWIRAHALVQPNQPGNPVARMNRAVDMLMGGGMAMLGSFMTEMQGTIVKRGAPAAVEFMAQEVQKRLETEQQQTEAVTTDPLVGNERSGVKQSVYGNTSAFAGSSSFQNIGDTHNTGIVDPHICGLAGTIEHDFAALIRRWVVMSDPFNGTGKDPRAF